MVILAGYCWFSSCYFELWRYFVFFVWYKHVLEKTVMFSAFSFANVLENTTVYLSHQQLEKELCKVLEERYGGTEELLKKLFPQRRVHQLIFKYETLMGRQLSLEKWRKLFKSLDMEQEFVDRVQRFKIGKNPRNIKTRKVWEVCKSYYHYNIMLLEFNFSLINHSPPEVLPENMFRS